MVLLEIVMIFVFTLLAKTSLASGSSENPNQNNEDLYLNRKFKNVLRLERLAQQEQMQSQYGAMNPRSIGSQSSLMNYESAIQNSQAVEFNHLILFFINIVINFNKLKSFIK